MKALLSYNETMNSFFLVKSSYCNFIFSLYFPYRRFLREKNFVFGKKTYFFKDHVYQRLKYITLLALLFTFLQFLTFI